jgi:uncharacterized membrane protein YcaP (DUF421 family)
MPEVLLVLVRGSLAFATLFVLTRMMGKRQVGQLTFFDYVNGITIGSIAASMTVDTTLETTDGLMGLLTWSFWVMLLGLLDVHSKRLRKIIDGEPTVVVQNGHILENNLEQLNYNVDDLRMQLRQKQAFNLADVEFAVVEPNGALSVLLKSQLQPVTPADLNLPTPYRGLAVELIMDGHVQEANLRQLNLSREWLEQEIAARGHRVQDVYYAEIDTTGGLYVDLRSDLKGVPRKTDISD